MKKNNILCKALIGHKCDSGTYEQVLPAGSG